MIMFNQLGLHVDFDTVDKMDTDVLFMTYEGLIEQEYQKYLSTQNK